MVFIYWYCKFRTFLQMAGKSEKFKLIHGQLLEFILAQNPSEDFELCKNGVTVKLFLMVIPVLLFLF